MKTNTKKRVFIISSFLIAFTCQSQTFTWAKKSTSYSSAVSSDQSANVYLLKLNKQLEKRNSSGTTVWNNDVYGDVVEIKDMTTDKSGNVYITGFYFSDRTQATFDTDGAPFISCGGNSISLPYTIVSEFSTIGHKMFFAKINTSGTLVWVKTFSTNTDSSVGYSLATDVDNNVYLLAQGSSSMTFGSLSGLSGSLPLFLLKVNSSGTEVFVKNIVNGYSDLETNYSNRGTNAIAVNSSGDVIVTRTFNGSKVFNPEGTTVSLVSSGGLDIFVAKYDVDGIFQWVKKIGGTGDDESNTVLLDNSGNVYLCGRFASTVDFDPSTGTVNRTSAGGLDMFVTSWTSAGAYRWVHKFGGTGSEPRCTMTKTDFDIVFSGGFSGTVDFNPDSGVTNLTSAGGVDIFTAKISSTGTVYHSAAYRIGSTSDDIVYDICTPKISGTSIIYQIGDFYGTVDFNHGAGVSNLTATGTEVCIIKTTLSSGSGIVVLDELVEINTGKEEFNILGLNDKSTDLQLEVSPNPFNDRLIVTTNQSFENSTLSICNMDGSLVYEQPLYDKQSILDLTSLRSGVYILNFQYNSTNLQRRIVKM